MDIPCVRCKQRIATFSVWFSESCPQETPGDYGHRLTWEQIMKLQFIEAEAEAVNASQAHPEKQEAT